MKPKWWVAAAAIVAVAIVVAALILKPWEMSAQNEPAHPEASVVSAEGGTFTFHDSFTVTVPKGAVDTETTLTVTAPKSLPAETGPMAGLRKAGLMFDIGLSRSGDNSIQPNEPLEVSFPLSGAYLPEGAAGLMPLLYTPNPAGGHLWLPSRMDGSRVHASVGHLSPKYVAYVNGQALLDKFKPKKVEVDRGECPQETTINNQKVKIQQTGWSLEDSSPIFACLMNGENGAVGVGVTNRVDYILIASATKDFKLTASQGDLEEEVIKYVAKLFPDGQKIKAYIGRDGKMVGQVALGDLPATIEVKGDPRTFMAENTVRLLGLAVGILTGEGDAGKTMQILGKLLEKGDLVSCIQKSLEPLSQTASFGDIANAASGCFGVLFSLLAEQMDLGKALWRVTWVADALKGAVDTAVSAANGIRLEFVNTMRVEVQSVVPPCPTGATLQKILTTYEGSRNPGVTTWDAKQTLCDFPWATGVTNLGYAGDPQVTNTNYLAHYEGGAWKAVYSGQDTGESPYCPKVTPKVREALNCR